VIKSQHQKGEKERDHRVHGQIKQKDGRTKTQRIYNPISFGRKAFVQGVMTQQGKRNIKEHLARKEEHDRANE